MGDAWLLLWGYFYRIVWILSDRRFWFQEIFYVGNVKIFFFLQNCPRALSFPWKKGISSKKQKPETLNIIEGRGREKISLVWATYYKKKLRQNYILYRLPTKLRIEITLQQKRNVHHVNRRWWKEGGRFCDRKKKLRSPTIDPYTAIVLLPRLQKKISGLTLTTN